MTTLNQRRRAHWRFSHRTLASWPRLMAAMGLGIVGGVIAAALGYEDWRVWAISGWDTFCASFLLLVLFTLAREGPDEIRLRSAQQDEGQGVILAFVLFACIVSVASVAMELTLAEGLDDFAEKAVHVGIALFTVTASWLVTQTMFAVHYAHEYYAHDPETRGDAGGLNFPGGEQPDYWDFLHFSMIIGVAAQTADVAFTDRNLRRLGTVHSLIAFAFNTVIVALTINLVAGVIHPAA